MIRLETQDNFLFHWYRWQDHLPVIFLSVMSSIWLVRNKFQQSDQRRHHRLLLHHIFLLFYPLYMPFHFNVPYIKNLANNLLPIKDPTSKNKPNTHPDKDKDDIPLKKAPILHPNAILAPYPINSPPRIAAMICFPLFIFLNLNCDASNVANRAPNIMPVINIEPVSLRKPPLI